MLKWFEWSADGLMVSTLPLNICSQVTNIAALLTSSAKVRYICFSSGGGTDKTPKKPQLKELMNALYHKVADKWKTIGVYLEISMGQLEAIAAKCQQDPHECLLMMLAIWLERVHPPATWITIIEAVEFLGEEQLGKKLREKHTIKEN